MPWFGSRAPLALLLVFLPVGARGVVSLDEVELVTRVDAQNNQDSTFALTITVTGTDIGTARITRQGTTPETIDIPCATPPSSTSCSVTRNLANQAALDMLVPTTATNYMIELKQGSDTITDTVSLARAAVPSSPAISEPLDGSTIDPGSSEVKFSPCATCTVTQGFLTQGNNQIDEDLDLPPSSTSWMPQAQLAGNSDFDAEIGHVIRSSSNQTADGPAPATNNDPYTFVSAVVHADEVMFSTGFPAPSGTFCVVVNDSGTDALDPTGCTMIDEPAAGILDTSGAYPTITAAGTPIESTLQLAANGRLSGIARADLDGIPGAETPTNLSGRLQSKDGLLRQRIRIPFDVDSDTRFTVRILEEANLATLQTQGDLEWLVEQKTSGKANGAKLSEMTTTTRETPMPVIGWRLEFTLTGTEGPTTGSLKLASGITVALGGRARFDTTSNQSLLKLKSDGDSAKRGIHVRFDRLVIDGTAITSGKLRFRIFGQSGALLLP